MKAVLKWPGGKRRQAERIVDRFGKTTTLVIPFLGAGSVLLETLERKPGVRIVAGDASPYVANLWTCLADPTASELALLALGILPWGECSRAAYADFRSLLNTPMLAPSPVHAALTIWVSYHGFNGLWRVSKAGTVNVSSGDPPKTPYDQDNFRAVARAVQAADFNFRERDFEATLNLAGRGHTVYCDPPYLDGFVGYTQDRFSGDDQRRLARACARAAHRGCDVWISNSSTSRHLYPRATAVPLDDFTSIGRTSDSRQVRTDMLYHYTPRPGDPVSVPTNLLMLKVVLDKLVSAGVLTHTFQVTSQGHGLRLGPEGVEFGTFENADVSIDIPIDIVRNLLAAEGRPKEITKILMTAFFMRQIRVEGNKELILELGKLLGGGND